MKHKSLIFVSVLVAMCTLLRAATNPNYLPSALNILKGDTNQTGYIWLLTDPHLDLNYTEGANPYCGIPVCCRTFDANQTARAGKFGTFAKCDTPLITYQSAVEFTKTYPIDPDFIFYIGDNPPHDDWIQTREINLNYAHIAHDEIKKAFPNKLVLSTIGNHDSFPVDQLDVPPKGAWFLQPMSKILSAWLTPEALKDFEYGGYYSMTVKPGLRIISLNTQYVNPLNFWLYVNLTDPAHQLTWLQNELTKAEQAHEKVYILGHIPAGIGMGDYKPSSTVPFNVGFSKLMERFQSIIVATFYGHVHHDFFKMFLDTTTHSKPTGVSFACPAVTSYSSTHPTVRLIKYDTTTFALLDLVTFYANLTEANLSGTMKWQLEYSAKDTYKLPDMTAASWYQVLNRLSNYSSPEWTTFISHYYVLTRDTCKDLECKKLKFCSMKYQDYDSYRLCTK